MLILPLMISNMTAYALARHVPPTPIYEALPEQDGIHLPHRGGPDLRHGVDRKKKHNEAEECVGLLGQRAHFGEHH